MKKTRTDSSGPARPTGAEVDEALDAAAHGVAPTSDDAAGLSEEDAGREREVDAIGKAAGVAIPDGKPLGGPDEIERRDAHRWELDPRSAEEPPPSDAAPSDKPGSPTPRARQSRSTHKR